MSYRRALVAVAFLVACGGIALGAPITDQAQGAGVRTYHGTTAAGAVTAPVHGTGIGTIHATAIGNPITFTLTGTGTGTVGATPFTEATFTLKLTTDTSLIIDAGGGVYQTPLTTATIDISGIGLATIMDQMEVFCATTIPSAGFADYTKYLDLCVMSDAAFAAYTLTTPIGPVSSAALHPVAQFQNVPTTLGSVSFSSYHDGTFTAAFGTGSGIPTASAPGLAILAVLLAAAGIVALRRLT